MTALTLLVPLAFLVLVWLGDRPLRERAREERWVRIEELREAEPDGSDEDGPR